MITNSQDDNNGVLESSRSPAEALRQQIEDWIDARRFDDDFPKGLNFSAIQRIAEYLEPEVTAYAATVEREAASRELKQLVADTLTPENVGGHFIHDEVKEFAKQQREFIEARLAALQGPQEEPDDTPAKH